MLADLHVHTTSSDGTESPAGVVSRAASAGLGALAIADHDTVEGIRPAMEEGAVRNIEVLPAIEIGTEYNGKEIHMLGYMIDIDNRDFLAELECFRGYRKERVVRMVERLRSLGLPVALDRVMEIAGPGSVGRPHIARALVEAGAAGSVEEAFDRYIAEGRPAFVSRAKCSPEGAIKIIKKAGGVPVLAHPGLSRADLLIYALIQKGLAGIEACHPGHSAEVVGHYRKICEQNGLIATGGSDYHGEDSRKHNRLGYCTVQYRVVEQIKELAQKIREKICPIGMS